jgi:hypothetical protein
METIKLEGKRYICKACRGVYDESTTMLYKQARDMNDTENKEPKPPKCQDCGLDMVELCPEDHACTCAATVHSGISYCKTCGDAVCPGCGSHDVAQISRVTGYLQEVGGWNAAKQQELLDRHRVDINFGIPT